MWSRAAAVTTMDDLKKYFRGEHWTLRGLSESALEAESPNYEVEVRAKGFMYHVHVEAVDDPSDSEDKVTDDPVKAIAEFLGAGTAGEEFFKRMSSGPAAMSAALRGLASAVERGRLGPAGLRRLLRRVAVAPDMQLARRVIRACARTAAGEDLQREELADLMAAMKKKGWRVEQGEDDVGLPLLTVDVSGIYTAEIGVENIPWQYSFSVKDHPDTLDEGVTDDPIEAFRRFYKSPEVQEAKAVRREETSETKPAPPSGYEKTELPPGAEGEPESGERTKRPGGPAPGEGETAKPPKRKPAPEEERTRRPGAGGGQ